jgi:hypothetical protein
MSSSDIIAIIGVAGTIIVPFVVLFLDKQKQNSIYVQLDSNRMKKIEGNWSGTFLGHDTLNTGERRMNLSLKVKRKEITGEAFLKVFDVSHQLNLKGGFRNDRFLILGYDNSQVVQFGTMILELKSSNDKLVGKLVGFGHLSETTLFGELLFQKVEELSPI